MAGARPDAVTSLLISISLLAAGACCSSRATDHPTAEVTSMEAAMESVTAIDLDLTDDERIRDVPIRIYLPDKHDGALPIVFVSHGIGESRTSYAWLGKAIASNGYAVIHPTHRGTDRATLDEGWIAMYKATKNKDNWLNRARDISFVLDSLTEIESMDPRLQAVFDPDRVGVVGHSAGAWTAAAIGGLELESGESLTDPRVDAIAPLSMPRTGSVKTPEAWKSLELPALHMTGTCDRQLVWWTFPADRRVPWENGVARDQYLLTLDGGTHTTFSNVWDPSKKKQSALQVVIGRAVAAFLDAYVADDESRRGDLRSGGFGAIGGSRLKVEQRPPAETSPDRQ